MGAVRIQGGRGPGREAAPPNEISVWMPLPGPVAGGCLAVRKREHLRLPSPRRRWHWLRRGVWKPQYVSPRRVPWMAALVSPPSCRVSRTLTPHLAAPKEQGQGRGNDSISRSSDAAAARAKCYHAKS